MSFVSDYQNLLIKQYWEKSKASAEIGLQAETWNKVFEFLRWLWARGYFVSVMRSGGGNLF